MKKLLLLPLLAFNLVQCVEIKEIFAPKSLGKVALYYNKNKFWVHHKGGYHKVRNCFVDKNLRKIDEKTLRAFVASNYISINKGSDNEFSLNAKVRGLGGGPGGAFIGSYIGKAIVSGIGHGTIGVFAFGALVTGGPIAAGATTVTLESWFGAAIETASLAGAVAGGILGGVCSGPA